MLRHDADCGLGREGRRDGLCRPTFDRHQHDDGCRRFRGGMWQKRRAARARRGVPQRQRTAICGLGQKQRRLCRTEPFPDATQPQQATLS